MTEIPPYIQANEAVLEFLSDLLQVPGGRLTLVSGRTSRSKRILLSGLEPHAVARALARATGASSSGQPPV